MIIKITEGGSNNYMDEEYDIFDPEIDEFIEKDYDENVAMSFEKDIREFLDYIISSTDDPNEQYTSEAGLIKHFKKHCIGHDKNKKSTRKNILYDFNDNSKYSDYENIISEKISNTPYIIDSLYDYKIILKYLRKLFEGNVTVKFNNGCNIRKKGLLNLSFHAYATDVTTNYKRGNTIDLCVKNPYNKTITLYAIDAYDVERRLNNTLKRYARLQKPFNFNHI